MFTETEVRYFHIRFSQLSILHFSCQIDAIKKLPTVLKTTGCICFSYYILYKFTVICGISMLNKSYLLSHARNTRYHLVSSDYYINEIWHIEICVNTVYIIVNDQLKLYDSIFWIASYDFVVDYDLSWLTILHYCNNCQTNQLVDVLCMKQCPR